MMNFKTFLLEPNNPSRAFEFCFKMIFEVGRNLRSEKKTKGYEELEEIVMLRMSMAKR